MKVSNCSKWFAKTSVIFAVLLLTAFLLTGCGDTAPANDPQTEENGGEQAPDDTAENEAAPELSGDAPRTDTPLYPGAEYVHEVTYPVAVSELYATDASISEVLEFYADYPGFENLPDIAGQAGEEGVYKETDLMNLLKSGASADALKDEIDQTNALLSIIVARSDEEALNSLVGQGVTTVLSPGKTIIVLRVLTEY
jgi:hypothetical protein